MTKSKSITGLVDYGLYYRFYKNLREHTPETNITFMLIVLQF